MVIPKIITIDIHITTRIVHLSTNTLFTRQGHGAVMFAAVTSSGFVRNRLQFPRRSKNSMLQINLFFFIIVYYSITPVSFCKIDKLRHLFWTFLYFFLQFISIRIYFQNDEAEKVSRCIGITWDLCIICVLSAVA